MLPCVPPLLLALRESSAAEAAALSSSRCACPRTARVAQALQHLQLANLDWGPLISTSDRAELNSAVHWACRQLTLLTALELEGCVRVRSC